LSGKFTGLTMCRNCLCNTSLLSCCCSSKLQEILQELQHTSGLMKLPVPRQPATPLKQPSVPARLSCNIASTQYITCWAGMAYSCSAHAMPADATRQMLQLASVNLQLLLAIDAPAVYLIRPSAGDVNCAAYAALQCSCCKHLATRPHAAQPLAARSCLLTNCNCNCCCK
jgi:hypothetical protein